MDNRSWLKKPAMAPEPAKKIPYEATKKFFAVDGSGSTVGSIFAAEVTGVLGLQTAKQDTVCIWDYNCTVPKTLDSCAHSLRATRGGTDPSCILKKPEAAKEIREADVWFLLTDGEIPAYNVTSLTRVADQEGLTSIPVVLLIVGHQGSSPDKENISVGVSFFASASDALIIYMHAKKGVYYVIDAKGVFEGLKDNQSQDLSDWKNLRMFKNEKELKKALTSDNIRFSMDRSRRSTTGISLGQEWDVATQGSLVLVSELLGQDRLALPDLRALLQEEAINQLSLACKTRGQLGMLRDLLIRHKQREVIVRLEDRHGAIKIMEAMQNSQDSEEKARLRDELQRAHLANREAYQTLRNHPSEEMKATMEINRLVDRALQIAAEFEKSSYTADILSRRSNRAKRAEKVSTADSDRQLVALDLSENVTSFRSGCSVCCGEDEIMSVSLKRLEHPESNTDNFALDFPLAAAANSQNSNAMSSQLVCFQCALLLERSIYHEDIVAVLPTVSCSGANKDYLIRQLYVALTADLKTGASGVLQLFAAILDQTLEDKSWCAKDVSDDLEVVARRNMMGWMLKDVLENCPCREDFTSTGEWVNYPKALRWAANEFLTADLDSWIIQYPIAGFKQLMRWYEVLDLSVDQNLLTAIRDAKLLNLVTTKVMDSLYQKHSLGDGWKVPYISVLYSEFNAPGVPRYLAHDTLVNTENFGHRLGSALNSANWSDIHSFLALFGTIWDLVLVRRVQMVVFWSLYLHKGHATPKTLFGIWKDKNPLAFPILDTEIKSTSKFPMEEVDAKLLSIFCHSNRDDQIFRIHMSEEVTPFFSPYGPSVLHCTKPGCGVKFYEYEDLDSTDLNLIIRERRAKHLSEAWAALPDHMIGQTGLPQNTEIPNAPSSLHYTLHISTAKVFSRLSVAQRQKIVRAVDANDREDADLQQYLDLIREQICITSHRGNIYTSEITDKIYAVLPSFVAALRLASKKDGLQDQSGCAFEFDWTQNKIIAKMEYELFFLSAS